ncbi:MAG: TolC family protein, partial [Verrucomicrobia bacterium]|nr:TolC family protein [Verrucomicrobiota bacterium]
AFNRSYLSQGGALTQQQLNDIIPAALSNVLAGITRNPALVGDLNSLSQSAFLQAEAQAFNQHFDSISGLIDLDKRLRNGVDAGISYTPNFVGPNSNEPVWPPTSHEFSLFLFIPLSKFGNTANDAEELAALRDYEGSLLTFAQAINKAASNTLDAYWSCAAALEKLAIADRSLRIAEALLQFSQELVKADNIPRTDLALAEAHRSQSFNAETNALIAVFDAAKQLAMTLGLTESQLRHLPLAGANLPTLTANNLKRLDEERLIDLALERRFDRKAALKGIESKRLLADKARIDLRPDVNLGFNGGLNLTDDSQLGVPGQHGYSLDPSVTIALTFSYPFANNQREGSVLSTQADLNKSILNLETLSRQITVNIKANVETLHDLVSRVEQGTATVRHFTDNLQAMQQRFLLGATTIVDTISAAENLAASETELVDAKLQLAEAIAHLRFESATLLSPDLAYRVPSFPQGVEKLELSRDTFTTLPDLSREPGPRINDRFYEPNVKYISGHPPWHR